MTEPMRIVELRAENFKRLQAVEIRPDADGSLVVISGRNGAGKSSTLDAIWAALGGGTAARETPRPVRDGAETAEVSIDLGKIRVTRKWSAGGGTKLEITSPEGTVYRSPQALIDGLVGRLSFDPLAFAQQPAREQLATLLDLVDLPFDPAELAETRREIFDRRTVVNRDLAKVQARIAGLPQIDADGLPDEEVGIGDLMQEYRAAQRAHDVRAQTQRDLDEAARDVQERTRELADAQDALEDAQQHLTHMERPGTDPLPDLAEIEKRMSNVGQTNQLIRAAAERRGLENDATGTLELANRLTEEIRDLDQQKADALAKAEMPIDGLAFDDDGVTYRGMPFKQCSSGEQLRVSVAMALAMNPDLRVILIRDGSLLDADNLRIIEEMAADRQAQVWLERVSDEGGVGIVIEDGAVVGAPAGGED